MASRLALKYGLVSEEDRLPDSSDALLVSEPTTGSKTRTKGSLYIVVSAVSSAGRGREACRLVADVIRREYYYDESAGIVIVLEKAIRAANRRLRDAREASGMEAGSIGVAAAVVRGNELYVASCGPAESYLIRSARLLMPEHKPGEGLPQAEVPRVDVWRGDFGVGDSLVLCSRNVVEVVGTEELKNAVVTLHPQSAVEHLHHLFVAAGGEGSDGALVIEATEVALSHVEHRLVPVAPSEPPGGAALGSPIPLADQLADAATAVQDRAAAARGAAREIFSGGIGRMLELMPRRQTRYRRIDSAANRQETRRRIAFAVLAFIAMVAVLGAVVWYAGPFRNENLPQQLTQGEAAYNQAYQEAAQALGSGDLIHSNPQQAMTLLQTAWADLSRAAATVDATRVNNLRDQIAGGLDDLYGTVPVTATTVYSPSAGVALSDLVRGPDGAAYAIAGQAVLRIDPDTGSAATIIQGGEQGGTGIGPPALLTSGGPDLLIVDASGALWRWRPSDSVGGGTLGRINVGGDQKWGGEVADIQTFLINADQGLYRLYVPYPPDGQILRYEPTADGSGFSAPNPYFVASGENVAAFHQLLVDGDVYAVTSDTVLRYFDGRDTTFALDQPPDNGDLRPGHDYRLMTASGERGVGQLFVWDKLHQRIVVFDKATATYVEQFVAAQGSTAFAGLVGMYLVENSNGQSVLYWATTAGIYRTVLETPGVAASPTPSVSASASPPASSGASGSPGSGASPSAGPSPSASPTIRPRRTPLPQ